MKIYSSQVSTRLEYTLNVIFNIVLKVEYTLTDNPDDLNEKDTFINYSERELKGGFQVYPDGILFEEDIIKKEIKSGVYQDLPVLFFYEPGDLPYDIFSAVFYMVSRYEEYLPFQGDKYGRFIAENSIALREGFHHLPIVELWIKQLSSLLKIEYPTDKYRQLLTIDIDNAWTYKNKPLLKTWGGILLKGLQFNFKEISKRLKVLNGKLKDPGDNFNYLESIQEKLKLPIQYFILVGRNRKYDNALSIDNTKYRALLKKLHAKNRLGLHPSFQSNKNFKILHKEYLKLSAIHKQEITRSRQHYLILNFPQTYENLMRLSVREDYSLGWSDKIGFRAGISRPHPFFNLKENKQTHLLLIPFNAMDRTLKDYMGLTPEDAIAQLKQMVDVVKEVGGQFTMLWHNDSLSDMGEWLGWKDVFEQVIEYAE